MPGSINRTDMPMRTGYLLIVLLIFCMSVVWAVGLRIQNVDTRLSNGVYLLDANIDYQLSQTVEEALSNSVPLTFIVEMNVHRARSMLWDETIHNLQQRFRLTYHALARQYVVKNLNSNQLHSFPTQAAAIEFIGRIRDFPLLDSSLLDSSKRYLVSVRAELDIESLPTPLRLIAYVSGDWRLSSDWFTEVLRR